MTEPNPKTDPEDELAGTEQPFVAHLMELRDRLIKALVAVGVVLTQVDMNAQARHGYGDIDYDYADYVAFAQPRAD